MTTTHRRARRCALTTLATIATLATLASLAACGGGSGGGTATPPAPDTSAAYFPQAIGDRWVYRTWSDSDTQAAQLELVQASDTATVAGKDATVLHATRAVDGSDDGDQYLAVDAHGVTQVPDPTAPAGTVQPPVMDVARFPLVAGSSFQQLDQVFDLGVDYDGDGHDESSHVTSTVTVVAFGPVLADAGTFADSVHLRTAVTQVLVYTGGAPSQTQTVVVDDWYARGVGLVREDQVTSGAGQPTTTTHVTLGRYVVGGVRSDLTVPVATLLKPATDGVQGPFTVVELAYSEAMDVATVTGDTVTLTGPDGQRVPLTVTRGASSFAFYPVGGTLASGTYTVAVGGGATDLGGNPVAAAHWQFAIDATAPAVVATNPADRSSYFPVDGTITVDFSEDIDPATVGGAVQLVADAYVDLDVQVAGRRITAKPRSPLAMRTSYQLLVQPWIRDRVGNPMAQTYGVDFRTDPGRFDYAKTSPMGSSPTAVAVGDVTGDGRNDVVMTNWFYFDPSTDYKLFVYPQQADGTLGAPVAYATQASYVCAPDSVAIADVDGDGRQDVVIGESGCGVEILKQDATGQLVPGGFLPSAESHLIRVRDLDGDGRPEILGIGWGTGQVAVWKQTLPGVYGGPVLYALDHYGWEDMDVGDVDGDGRPDVVVSSGQGDLSHALAILHQQPDGSFGQPAYRADGPLASVAIGDVDGDGRKDIVVGRWFDSSIGVLRQDAHGQLGATSTIAAPSGVGALEIADLDGDGRADIVGRVGAGFGVWWQQADGSLSAPEVYDAQIAGQNEPASLAVADIDGDGRPDLVGAGLACVLNRGTAGAAPTSFAARVASAARAASPRHPWSLGWRIAAPATSSLPRSAM